MITYEELINFLKKDGINEIEGKNAIFSYMSQDKENINSMIVLLDLERKRNKEIICDMNEVIGRNTIFIVARKDKNMLEFIAEKTKELYKKWAGFLSPNMNLWFKE